MSDSRNIEDVNDLAVESGIFNIYKENVSEKSNELTFRYTINETQNVYVYFACRDVASVLVTKEDGFAYNQSLDNKPYVLDLGTVEGGTDVYLSYSLKDDSISGSVSQYVYGLDKDKFINAYNTIKENGVLDVTENRESYIKGTINLANGKMLYTSIPYDKGWSVFVDGNKVADENIVKMGNALIGVYMEAGGHTVEFRYTPPGLVPGVIISVIGFLILAIVLLLKKRKSAVFSSDFRQDVLELGRWRDITAETERDNAEAVAEEEFSEILDEAINDEIVTPEEDDAWNEALAAAESFAKTTSLFETELFEEKSEKAEEPEQESQTEEVPEDDESEEDELSEHAVYNEVDSKPIADVIDEFEKSTDEYEDSVKTRISAEDKKSANKKKFNLTLFVIIIVVAVIAAVAIMLFAAGKNSDNPDKPASNDTTVNSTTLAPGFVIDPTSEEDVSEVLTTVSTTVSETTTEPESTTADVTTEVPTEPVVDPEPSTERVTSSYNGAYEEYQVRSGDNFYSILRSFGIATTPENVQTFRDINGFSAYDGLAVGQIIKVPTDL